MFSTGEKCFVWEVNELGSSEPRSTEMVKNWIYIYIYIINIYVYIEVFQQNWACVFVDS